MRTDESGFSLIELLIVVAIILIIAAIAIPNLLRSKMSANEASAGGSMRIFINCTITYQASNPNVGFPDTIVELGPVSGGGNGCLDPVLTAAANGGASKNGYLFTYLPTNNVGGVNGGFSVTAFPLRCARTGTRSFFVDETGILRFENDAAADCPLATATSLPAS